MAQNEKNLLTSRAWSISVLCCCHNWQVQYHGWQRSKSGHCPHNRIFKAGARTGLILYWCFLLRFPTKTAESYLIGNNTVWKQWGVQVTINPYRSRQLIKLNGIYISPQGLKIAHSFFKRNIVFPFQADYSYLSANFGLKIFLCMYFKRMTFRSTFVPLK